MEAGENILAESNEALHPGGAELTRHLLALAKLPAGSRLLDMGCGDGGTLALLKEEYGFECSGLEPDPRHLAAARQSCGCDIVQGRGENIPFADNSFDGVLAECTLSLCDPAMQALAEIKRVLRPGGKLLLTDVYALRGEGFKGSGLLRYLRTAAETKQLLADAGLQLLHSEDCGQVLKWQLAQLILDHGAEEAYRRLGLGKCCRIKDAGYLLLIAQKPIE